MDRHARDGPLGTAQLHNTPLWWSRKSQVQASAVRGMLLHHKTFLSDGRLDASEGLRCYSEIRFDRYASRPTVRVFAMSGQ